ncbi:MAG: peroxidase family protein [Actinomycetes bacterium]
MLAPAGASKIAGATFAGTHITITTVGALGVKHGDTVTTSGMTPTNFNKANAVVDEVVSNVSFTVTFTGANPQAATATVNGSSQVTSATLPYGATGLSGQYPYSNLESYGVRNVDGSCNNITNILARSTTKAGTAYNQVVDAADSAGWGAGDQNFIRLGKQAVAANYAGLALNDTLSPTQIAYQDASSFIVDPTPRLISNLISDQTDNNPAAVAAADQSAAILYGAPTGSSEVAVNATTGRVSQVQSIPNVTPDYNVSAGYNSWFTLFGQFFDHGLDLVPKGGSNVYIPLDQNDPVYVDSQYSPNYMVLTRAADPNNSGDSLNITTPYIDQSQTYGSHASTNFFMREYRFDGTNGAPSPTGRLVEGSDQAYTTLAGNVKMPSAWVSGGLIRTDAVAGSTLTDPTGANDTTNHGLAQWKDMKAQARLLGLKLTDFDVNDVPVIATDAFGNFVADPATGFPMVLMTNGSHFVWASGNPTNPIVIGGDTLSGISGYHAVSSGHAFINDTMSTAVPFGRSGAALTPDHDTVMNSPLAIDNSGTYYDDESLDVHYVAGDGRVNENIGLSSIHSVFHSEHNVLAQDITNLLAADGGDPLVTSAFRSEWKNADGTMNGNRLYAVSRWITEMEYQHMVYDEFVRRISPSLPLFIAYDPTVNAGITAEFASAVYRLGHSMLNETIARSNPGTFYDPASNQDVSLITAFTNPAQARLVRPAAIASASGSSDGSSVTYTMVTDEIAPNVGSVVSVSGMTNSQFNILSGVVSARTRDSDTGDGSFEISQYYPPAGSGEPMDLNDAASTYDVADTASTVTTVSDTDSTSVAKVAIDDPGDDGYDFSAMTSAAMIAQGMSSQRGNEIDEFVTDGVRNNLLGLPLDLASLNLTRGRDTQLPTLNQYRAQNNSSLPAYTSWIDFFTKMRYPESGVNFVAAYGTHPTLLSDEVATITEASATTDGSHLTITYTVSSTAEIVAGDTVDIDGLTAYNFDYAIVDSVTDATHFVVKAEHSDNPLAVKTFTPSSSSAGDVADAKAEARAYSASLTHGERIEGAVGGSAVVAVEEVTATLDLIPTSVQEKRKYAAALLEGGLPVNITDAVSDSTSHTFTGVNYFQVGQIIKISGVTGLKYRKCWNTPVGDTERVIAADATSFTVENTNPAHGDATCGGYIPSNGGTATFLSNGTSESPAPPADSRAFLNGTLGYAGVETGINHIDLWIGGLAENPGKQPITPPVLGITFQQVFEDQMLKMQNGDRFYYLARTAGMNVGQEIPAQKFTDIIRRNTPSAKSGLSAASQDATGILGMNSPGFAISDCAFTAENVLPSNFTDNASCGSGTMSTIADVITHSGLDNVTGFGDPGATAGVMLSGGAGDDGIFGGSGNDYLSGGISGGDLIDGFAGNDVIIGGPGEDLIKGGAGNDNINAGESQLGDTIDGNSGGDFIHTGNATGATASLIGEAGNDYIQGSKASDLALFGGEGADWMEGKADIDTMFGDGGLVAAASLISGSDDVVDGQSGNDLTSGDSGNDIIKAGDGADIIDGGDGFDFVSYEKMRRHDNGATLPVAVYADLGGVTPNPLTMPADAYVNLEGVSGSIGSDNIISGQGQSITIPTATGITGVQGSQVVTINAAQPEIVPGMTVTGAGIGAHATVFGAVQNALGAVTITQVTLTVENVSSVTGPLTFLMPKIANADYITGLKPLLKKSIGWNAATNTWGGSVANANGGIFLGGDGNDNIQLLGGSNVVDGSKHIRTCILVDGYTTGSDTACGSGNGFSTMSLIGPAVDAGTVNAGHMHIVRELVDSTVQVSQIVATGSAITYTTTSPHAYTVGDKVSVSGTSFGSGVPIYDVANATVTGVTSSTFTVASTATAATRLVSASAQFADILALPGAQNTYTFTRVNPLPEGAESGYTITDATGTNTVYNVQSVSFAGAAPVALSGVVASAGFVPTAPQNPTASSESASSVLVTWRAPASDSGSAVRTYTARAFNSVDGNNLVATPCTVTAPATSCVITGLPEGQAAFVDVVATSLIGDSAPSTRAAVVPVSLGAAPSSPRNVKVLTNGANTRLQVMWDTPTSDGGSSIASYSVTTYTLATGSVARTGATCTVNAPATTCIVTLPAGGNGGGAVQNWVSVVATNAAAVSSAPSVRVRGTASANAGPAAPTAVAATPNGSGTVDVGWTAPAVNGATPITGYGIRVYNAATAGTLLADVPTNSTNTSFQLTNMTDGVQYWVAVYARNSGTPVGTVSARVAVQDRLKTANAVVGAGSPSGAVGVTLDVDSNGTTNVLWTDAIVTGGAAIANYDVSVVNAATGSGLVTHSGVPSPSTFTGLTSEAGVQYLAQVTTNGAYGSTASDYQLFTPLAQAGPDAPTGLTTGYHANGSIDVTWHASTTGYFGRTGSSVPKYRIYLMTQEIGGTVIGTPTDVVASEACLAGVCTAVVSGLSNTVTYFVTVAGVNNLEFEGPKALPLIATVAITVPTAPVVSAVVTGPEVAHVTWTVAATGGSAIDGWTVTAHQTGAADNSADVVLTSASPGMTATTTSVDVSGLAAETSSTISVTVHNGAGDSSAGTANITTPAITDAPSAPGSLAVTIAAGAVGEGSLSWTAPTWMGSVLGTPLTQLGATAYTVKVYNAALAGDLVSSYNVALATSPAVTPTTQVMTGLTAGETYYATVVAISAGGTSVEPDRVQFTPLGVPTAMTAPTVNFDGSAGAQVLHATWVAPTASVDTGGTAITSYTVNFFDVTTGTPVAAGTCTVAAPATTCSRAQATVPALVVGQTYSATVSATNARGAGHASAAAEAILMSISDTPERPTWPQWSGTAAAPLSSVNLGSGKVILYWNKPISAGLTATDSPNAFSYDVKLYTTVAGAVQPTLTATLTQRDYTVAATTDAVVSVVLSGLTNGTAYFASVTATNNTSHQGLSPTRQRIAASATNLPTVPRQVASVTGSTGVALGQTVNLNLSVNPPATLGGAGAAGNYAMSYQIDVYSAATGGTLLGTTLTDTLDARSTVIPRSFSEVPIILTGASVPAVGTPMNVYAVVRALNQTGVPISVNGPGTWVTGVASPRTLIPVTAVSPPPPTAPPLTGPSLTAPSSVRVGGTLKMFVGTGAKLTGSVGVDISAPSGKSVGAGSVTFSGAKSGSFTFKLPKRVKKGTYLITTTTPVGKYSVLLRKQITVK